jgi:SAM-dependent methyltransferase
MSIGSKKPWPTKDAMTQVYEKNLWGGEEGEFYSGFGAHDPKLVKPYIEVVSDFLKSFDEPLIVCDLGCGDFNVSKELVPYTKKYIAVDVVDDLIQRNKMIFQDDKLDFQCLDISTDELPKGDVAILRHVLQHLSNAEVQCILSKLSDFKYVIITEHIPEGEFKPNKDIISGQGTRLKKKSGLVISEPPFAFTYEEESVILSISYVHGEMMTVLYTMS